jgi:lysophospholipase L1-like esterase/dienelactone hydrolase
MIKYLYAMLLTASLGIDIAEAQIRYKETLFTAVDSFTNIPYGEALNLKGKQESLLLDVLMPPQTDTINKRPLLIFIHGGGFQNNSKNGSFSAMLCSEFAKRGYVTATIDYRLGVEKGKTQKDYAEALYRAQQDGKAAIRFFRKHAAKYGIDTTQIFITGSSAGSKTCLAIAYMNEDEVPKDINQSIWGTLDGNSGNAGYSSKVAGVLNCWGAMFDYRWIQQNDVPLFNVAGTEDKVVPYDSAFAYHGFKYGPYILYQHCLSLGIATGWRPFEGAGHTLDNNKQKQDSCIQAMAAWLFTQLAINNTKNNGKVFRWEPSILQFDSLNQVQTFSSKAILFVGSSYIRFWESIEQDLHYKPIINRGFGGANLSEVAYYTKRIIYPHQPKAIFLYVGNDITGTNKDKSPDQVVELFKYIVKTIRVKYPTIPIGWIQIAPSEKRWKVWNAISQANSLIEAYCVQQPNVYYIKYADKLLSEEGLPITTYYKEDKLHFNESGYRLWGKLIAKQVKKITKQ